MGVGGGGSSRQGHSPQRRRRKDEEPALKGPESREALGTQKEQLTVSTSCCRMGQLLPLLGFFLLPFKAQSPRTESLGAGGGSSGLSLQGGQTRDLTPTGVGEASGEVEAGFRESGLDAYFLEGSPEARPS